MNRSTNGKNVMMETINVATVAKETAVVSPLAADAERDMSISTNNVMMVIWTMVTDVITYAEFKSVEITELKG